MRMLASKKLFFFEKYYSKNGFKFTEISSFFTKSVYLNLLEDGGILRWLNLSNSDSRIGDLILVKIITLKSNSKRKETKNLKKSTTENYELSLRRTF